MSFSLILFVYLCLAAFKVIKALLPPKAVEILKMISKKDVTQYVPKDNCLVSWGGSDSYEFQFVPEPKRVVAKPKAANAGDDDQPPHDEMGLDKKVGDPRNPLAHEPKVKLFLGVFSL